MSAAPSARWRGLSPATGFTLRFLGFLLLASVGFWALSLHARLGPIQRAIAASSATLARGSGGTAEARGDDIVVRDMVMNVNHECTGIFVIMLFGSFVLAYPASWRARVTGLGVGIPLFMVVNVLRLATLARIVEFYPNLFFYLHEYVWQGILTVLVLLGTLAWAERLR